MTPETKTPTRAEALAALNKQYDILSDCIGNGCEHGFKPAKSCPNEGCEKADAHRAFDVLAALATDAPIVEGHPLGQGYLDALADTKSAEQIDEALLHALKKHAPKGDLYRAEYNKGWNDCVDAFYAQGRTQAVPDYSAFLNAYSLLKHAAQHQVAVPWGLIMPQLEQHSRSLSAAPPVTGGAWLPIESAPKDGTKIQISDGTNVWSAKWSKDYDEWAISKEVVVIDITHWQPLPTPPSAQTRGG